MKLLIDENLPHDLREWLNEHECFTAAYMGWAGKRNGELLRLAASEAFDALITLDRGMMHQHNVDHLPLTVFVLVARSNRVDHVKEKLASLRVALQSDPLRRFIIVD